MAVCATLSEGILRAGMTVATGVEDGGVKVAEDKHICAVSKRIHKLKSIVASASWVTVAGGRKDPLRMVSCGDVDRENNLWCSKWKSSGDTF